MEEQNKIFNYIPRPTQFDHFSSFYTYLAGQVQIYIVDGYSYKTF
jgi:hypothetical protein